VQEVQAGAPHSAHHLLPSVLNVHALLRHPVEAAALQVVAGRGGIALLGGYPADASQD